MVKHTCIHKPTNVSTGGAKLFIWKSDINGERIILVIKSLGQITQ
jgi:hypothetical protein